MNWEPLVAAALAARGNAYAPYSRYPVGAAITAADGRIFAGCNVENRSYGLTVCAERNALAAAVVAGARRAVAVAVVTDSSPPAPPCGLCLQALSEFAEDLPVLLTNVAGERRELRLSELLPHPFVFEPPNHPRVLGRDRDVEGAPADFDDARPVGTCTNSARSPAPPAVGARSRRSRSPSD